ncbi:MAG: sensor histidine kinase [Candidatus Brocadiales bacterium]
MPYFRGLVAYDFALLMRLAGHFRGLYLRRGWHTTLGKTENEAKECSHSEELKSHITRLKGISQRLESAMEGLLSISRISNLEKSPISANKLMEHVLRKTANQLELLNIHPIKNLSSTAPNILGNNSQLETVFTNIVSTALDAMPKGGTLTVQTEHLTGENKVEVTISDTGTDINKKDLPYLFDPYFILKIRPAGRCTGLELALAQLAVQSHGGTIEADSEEGRGTTFRVKLPVYKEGV